MTVALPRNLYWRSPALVAAFVLGAIAGLGTNGLIARPPLHTEAISCVLRAPVVGAGSAQPVGYSALSGICQIRR